MTCSILIILIFTFILVFLKVFQTIDADGSGLITPEELRKGFSQFGVVVSLEEAQSLVRKCDKDNDGRVNYEGMISIYKLLESIINGTHSQDNSHKWTYHK